MLLLKRYADQHCGDLWSFPGGKVEADEDDLTAARREFAEETGLKGSDWERLGESSHTYSDRALSFILYRCCCDSDSLERCESPGAWVEVDQLSDYPMPAANRQIVQLLNEDDT